MQININRQKVSRYFKSNFSTEAHVPWPCNGQYLKYAHNQKTIVASMDMVVRMPKVLAITRSWYVCFSALISIISNLAISADLHGTLAPEEYTNWKSQFPCSQKRPL